MPEQSNGNIKALKILHSALMMGVVMFGAIAFFLVYANHTSPVTGLDKPLQVIALILCAAGMYFSNKLFKQQIETIKQSGDSVKEKINKFRAACIMQWALLEGPALFTVIALFLTCNYAFLILAGIMICALYIAGPSKQRIMQHLHLNEIDGEQL
ncbi:MAG: hypothetical protein ABIP30_09230 [Ferruginibacter sp.]